MVPRNACLANFMHRKQGGIREFNTALVPGLGVQVISVLEEEARRFTFPCLGRFVSVSRVCFLRSVPFRFPSFVLFFIFFCLVRFVYVVPGSFLIKVRTVLH